MNKLLDSLEMIKSSKLFEVRRQAEENNLSDNVFLKYIEEYTDEIKSSSERIVSNGIDRLMMNFVSLFLVRKIVILKEH